MVAYELCSYAGKGPGKHSVFPWRKDWENHGFPRCASGNPARNATMNNVVIYTDGGARGNPGPAGAGVVIQHDGTSTEVKKYLGPIQTNNWAEYEAVVIALEKAKELGLSGSDIEFRLDSKLVVEQLMGNWKIKEPSLKPQVAKVRALLPDFGRITFTYVPRAENKEADRLVNEALDEA
jgi:ribonuclease H / adenosylcobalamin/alpha-ribazole phosphatase